MAAKKKKTTSRSMSADTYERKSAAKSSQLRRTGMRYDSLEAALIDSGVPMSKSEQVAQIMMEKAMRRGPARPTPKKGK